MPSEAVKSLVSGARPLAKRIVEKCFNCHSCPPSGSTDFFSEIANRRVKTGTMLETGHRGLVAHVRMHLPVRRRTGRVNCTKGVYVSFAISTPN